MTNKKGFRFFFKILTFSFLCLGAGTAFGADISGTVKDSAGFVITAGGTVEAYTSNPCDPMSMAMAVGSGSVQQDGTYIITTDNMTLGPLPAGSYYLKARSYGNHISEWWADPASSPVCGDAGIVEVPEAGVIDKDFQLDPGATISGTVTDSGGTPITDGYVHAYSGTACNNWNPVGTGQINSNGTYTIEGLPAGTYFLQASSNGNHISEWWADPASTPDCTGSEAVMVVPGDTPSGMNFQLNKSTTISGTVKDSAGDVITTGGNVEAYTGTNACDPTAMSVGSGGIDMANGTYTIVGMMGSALPAGTYYLKASSNGNHVAEWRTADGSSPSCIDAVGVSVAAEDTVTDRDFALDIGATISGMVTDSAAAIIPEGGSVGAFTGSACNGTYAGGGSFDTETGNYIITGLPAGTYFLQADADGNYIAEWWADPSSNPDCNQAQQVIVGIGGTPEGTVINKDFQLNKSSGISGTVKDSAGNAITTGGTVEAYSGDPCDPMSMTVGYSQLDENGSYNITADMWGNALPAGDYYLKARAYGNYVAEWLTSTEGTTECGSAEGVHVDAETTIAVNDFKLDIGAQISGTVISTDQLNNPVTGGDVHAYSGTACNNWNPVGTGQINSNGTYTIEGLPAGTYFLQASSDANHISEWWADPASTPDCTGAEAITVEAGDTPSGKNFQLDPGATISGSVTDSSPDSNPITEGQVTVYTGSPCGDYNQINMAGINPDGTYIVTGLPAGTYFLKAEYNGNYIPEWWASSGGNLECASAEAVTVNAGDTFSNKNFQLDIGAQISGTVISTDQLNNPVAGGYVHAYSGTACNNWNPVGTGQINSNGTYTIEGLQAGTYFLQASSDDNHISGWWADPASTPDCTGAEAITVNVGDTFSNKNFQLDIGAQISGTVISTDQVKNPVTRGYVQAYSGTACNNWNPVGNGQIKSNGTYTIEGLPAGTYFLQASSDDNHISEWWASSGGSMECASAEAVTVKAGDTPSGMNFQLDVGATISGTVTSADATKPISYGYVSAYTGDPCARYDYAGSTDFNQDGNYIIQGLPSGTYFVRAEPLDDHVSEWWKDGGSTSDCSLAQTVSVIAGGTTTGKDFQLDNGGMISGTVTDSDGGAITSGYVEVYSGSPCGPFDYIKRAYLDSNGSYTTRGILAGNYYLKAYSNGSQVAEWWKDGASSPDCNLAETVAVTTGETTTNINFQLDNGGMISGIVTDSNNDPITNGSVDVVTGDPCDQYEHIVHAELDSNGFYMTRGIPAGADYYVKAYSNDGHVSEWWKDGASSPDCSLAQTVSVTAGGTTENTNFQLDNGGMISGIVTDSNNNPITNGSVSVVTGEPCDQYEHIVHAELDSNGFYMTRGIPAGPDYYVKAYSNDGHVSEWWKDGDSTSACSLAQTVSVTEGGTTTGKDFQLNLGGTISGTVKDSNNVTITSGYVEVYTGSPCGQYKHIESAEINLDGSYTTRRIPAGTAYYLKAYSNGAQVAEWWKDGGSTSDCSLAETVTVTAGQATTDKDFQLDNGGTISGIVTDSNNDPITNGSVDVFTGNPCSVDQLNYIKDGEISPDGTYTIHGISTGTEYYLRYYSDSNYSAEWWASGGSTSDCRLAEKVSVTAEALTTGKDFHLDVGGRISGIVKDHNDNAIINGHIEVYTGAPCDVVYFVDYAELDSNGSYITSGIHAGTTYYLKAKSDGTEVAEWWKDGGSTSDCSLAETVTVTAGATTTGKDFQLDDSTGTTYTVTTAANPADGGTVTPGNTYNAGTLIRLTAAPNAGYAFTGWTGTTGTGTTIDMTVDETKTITANFVQTFTVTTSATPAAGGTVTPGGTYNAGTVIPLTATPNTGYAFTGWTGTTGTGTTIDVTVDETKTITANFVQTFTVTTSANPAAGGTVTPGGTYNAGTVIPLTATPNTGYAFTGWTGTTETGTTINVTVNENKTISANFVQTVTFTVTTSANPAAGGTVTPGNTYNAGTVIPLTATPNPGYAFTSWSGATGTGTTIDVTVDETKTITANFVQTFTVTTSAYPAAGGTVEGGGIYNAGVTATLTAIPAEGYVFTGWSGDSTETTLSIEVTVDEDKTYRANFLDPLKKNMLLFPIRAKDGQVLMLSL